MHKPRARNTGTGCPRTTAALHRLVASLATCRLAHCDEGRGRGLPHRVQRALESVCFYGMVRSRDHVHRRGHNRDRGEAGRIFRQRAAHPCGLLWRAVAMRRASVAACSKIKLNQPASATVSRLCGPRAAHPCGLPRRDKLVLARSGEEMRGSVDEDARHGLRPRMNFSRLGRPHGCAARGLQRRAVRLVDFSSRCNYDEAPQVSLTPLTLLSPRSPSACVSGRPGGLQGCTAQLPTQLPTPRHQWPERAPFAQSFLLALWCLRQAQVPTPAWHFVVVPPDARCVSRCSPVLCAVHCKRVHRCARLRLLGKLARVRVVLRARCASVLLRAHAAPWHSAPK